MNFLKQLYYFSRFHTVIGTTLSIVVLYLMAATNASTQHLYLLLFTLVACLGANIYIVGLNQITDIEIDKINKPWLPLASGAFSLHTGYIIIFIGLAIAIAGGLASSRFLLLTIGISLLLGTIYSLPPLRLKRFHFWAAFCIIAIRGLVVNFLIFLHFQYSINQTTHIPFLIYLLAATILIYSIIIAWFKDMPDIQGDRAHEINTLSVRLGAQRIKTIGVAVLMVSYVVLLVCFAVFFSGGQRIIGIGLHLLCGIYLLLQSKRMNPSQVPSIRRFYLNMWILFFVEYIGFASISTI